MSETHHEVEPLAQCNLHDTPEKMDCEVRVFYSCPLCGNVTTVAMPPGTKLLLPGEKELQDPA